MPTEQYAFGGLPAAPHTAAVARPPPRPPQTAAAAAAASTARSYSALLSTHHQARPTAHPHYIPQMGPVPPLPQRFAARPPTRPRRLSNVPSDPSDGVHAGPVRAGPANGHASSSDAGDTSEDEIESLKRAMGSDQWALHRQRMRRDRQAHHPLPQSNAPSSPATQDTVQSAPVVLPPGTGPAPAVTAPLTAAPGHPHGRQGPPEGLAPAPHPYTLPHHPQLQPPPLPRHPLPLGAGESGALQPPQLAAYDGHASAPADAVSGSAYAYSAATLPTTQPYAHGNYPTHRPRQHQPQPLAPASGAYAVPGTNPYAYGTMASAGAHALPALAHVPGAGREYIVAGYAADPAQHRPAGVYPSVLSAAPDSASHLESASVRSNDQMSGTVTDASGYSQVYWAQGTPQPHFQPPRTYEVGAAAAVAVSGSSYPHQSPTLAQAQPPIPAAPASPTSAVPGPMQEMREQRQYSAGASAAPAGSSAFAIQSLLNPPVEAPADAPRYQGGEGSGSTSTAAVLQHIAKENARFRRQSEASAHRQALAPPALAPRNDGSPNSQSSYRSAGYSAWYGRADTVMDYATAKQSFSSIDDASETTPHQSSAYLAGAPVPALPPPPYASSVAAAAAAASATAATAAEAMAAFEATVASSNYDALQPVDAAPPAGVEMAYRGDARRNTKPISILVQVGDGSEEGSANFSGDDLPAASGVASMHYTLESSDSEAPLDGGEPGRKATMESLDNVLEYYRTSPATADPPRRGSAATTTSTTGADPAAAAAAAGGGWPSPADMPLHYRMGHGSSLGSLYQVQSSPLAQRTSMSSPIAKPAHSAWRAEAAPWPPAQDDAAASSTDSGSDSDSDSQPPGIDSGYWPESRQQQQQQQHPLGVSAHGDIFSMLDQLSEPDDLELPPTSMAVDCADVGAAGTAAANARLRLVVEGAGAPRGRSDSIVQMESLDGLDGLSDFVDLSSAPGSECGGYTDSNDSTDSFGEPIEHETGMLPKSLLETIPRTCSSAAGADVDESISRLADDFARVSLALSTARAPAAESRPADGHPESMSHSTRTNVSTLNASNESAVPHSPGSIDDDTMHEVQGARPDATSTAGSAMAATAATTTATAHAASAATLGLAVPAVAPANRMPLEIMELASELELALAREQEDYYSDNDPVLPTLDPAILQSLGRAVRQQCLLQRQQMQRRKSNMQLGLTHGGTEEAGGPDATLAEAALDDHEWPGMQAVLADVSQYFVQSGLNLVFPFSAKWVDWLTRHPDRPFPWRKDPEDDLALLRDDGQGDGDGGTGGGGDDGGPGAQSDASSFYGEPPALSRPLPPDDVLSIAMIPMSKRRPTRVSDFVTQEKRRGINAHWQYYSVINQITAVASSIHHKLQLPEAEADHTYVAHELAALYQFLGGDFKKYKAQIEHVFDTVKQGLGVQTPPGTMAGTVPVPVAGAGPVVLGAECAADLREMMASIIVDALYAMNKVAPSKEQPPPPNTPTGTARARQDQHHVGREPVSYAISTLKGLPTQPIIRYLAREMRVVHADHHHHHQQRRRRGLAHNLSRNSSANHLRHPQYTMYQAPPLPPLPHQPLPGADTPSHGRSDSGHDSGPLTISAAAPGLQSGSTT